jgi:hypothetical protein
VDVQRREDTEEERDWEELLSPFEAEETKAECSTEDDSLLDSRSSTEAAALLEDDHPVVRWPRE